MMNSRQQINETLLCPVIDYSLIKIEDNNYTDDVWENKEKGHKVNLNRYNELPKFKEQIRFYLLNQYRKNEFTTVVSKHVEINFLYDFLRATYPGVEKVEDINELIVSSYLHHVISYKRIVNHRDGNTEEKGLSKTRLIKNAKIIEEILEFHFREGTLGVSDELLAYTKKRKEELILSNPRVKNDKNRKPTTKKEYSKETIKNIIVCAYNDEDLYAKTMIMIETQVGLRISEILSIEEDAIIGSPGKYMLGYTTTKTKKGEVYVEKPINDIAAEVLQELIAFTEPIRKRLKTKKVFVVDIRYLGRGKGRCYVRNYKDRELYKDKKYNDFVIKESNINRNFIRPFLKRWNITEDGKPIDLSTHYGRHFFAHLSWLEGMSVQSIRYMLNHDSFAMTAAYMYNAEKSMKEKFKEMMASPEFMAGKNVGDYQNRLAKDNVFKGKTEKQLDAIIGVMNIQILPNGACMHHPLTAEERLSKCSRKCDTCERFVTHACYLEVHERRVKRLEQIMEDALKNNKKLWYERTKKERDYVLKTYIEPLKAQNEII